MASLAKNVARVCTVFNMIKTKVKSYVAMDDILNPLKIEEYVNAIDTVFKSGVVNGKQAQYDEFWDAFQQNGSRTNYVSAFYGDGWNKQIFKPKYSIKPTGDINNMFLGVNTKPQVSMSELEEELNIQFDFSGVTDSAASAFRTSIFSQINVLDLSNATNITYLFYSNHSTGPSRIERLILSEKNVAAGNPFGYCRNLTHVGFEGVLATQNVDLSRSTKLDKESIVSLINILSTTRTGYTITLSKVAVNTAFGINVDDTSTYTDEWKSLTESKKNWNIAYA